MAEIIPMKESLCESCEHTLICIHEDPEKPKQKCRHYLKRRVEGYWIRQDDTFTRYQCSACGERNRDGHGNYCPACGASMKRETQSEPKERAMWIPYYNGGIDRREFRCSKCWNGTKDDRDSRCLNCGSEMLRGM